MGHGHLAAHETTLAPSMAMSTWLTSREGPLVLTKEFCLGWVPGRSGFSVGCSLGPELWTRPLDLVISEGCPFWETKLALQIKRLLSKVLISRPIHVTVKTKTKLLWTEQTTKPLKGQRRTEKGHNLPKR